MKIFFRWTVAGWALIFALAANSIWCLLAEFYGICSMWTFTFFISLPALVILAAMGLSGRWLERRRFAEVRA